MEANELRIGNYIEIKNLNQNFGYKNKIQAITNNLMIDIILYNTIIRHVHPILLTDEILHGLKLKQVSYMINGCYYFGNNKYIIGAKQADGKYTIEVVNGDNENYVMSFKYLHTLQNIYYLLTGQELKINL